MALSKTQVRRLGERLAAAEFPSEADLDLLAEYEASFQPALDSVGSELAKRYQVRATPRRKSVTSIVGKIRREHTRLDRMQDIAGCRVVVGTISDQEALLERIALDSLIGAGAWGASEIRVDDRREHPSHGYRAVHLIVTVGDRWVEVQLRTRLQDKWAQISEKLADRFGIEVKYGGGPAAVRTTLDVLSERIEQIEQPEFDLDASDDVTLSEEERDALRANLAAQRDYLHDVMDLILGI